MEKNFDTINMNRIGGIIEQGTGQRQQQTTAGPEEQTARAAAGRTQGRKGCKAARINMAFDTENYEFIKIMAGVTGQNMTQFVNFVISQYRQDHPDIYNDALKLIERAQSPSED